jgi:catechol 2,3-dioxygenase-like lactoylglutathione lyase family enzyme
MTAPADRPFTLDHLDHVVLRVRDLEKSIAFYEMLGGEVSGPRPAGTAVRITDGQTIILQKKAEYVPAELSALDHINLNIRAQDIQQVTSYLRANGCELVREAGEGGDTVRVLDPDRNVIEIRMVREGQR